MRAQKRHEFISATNEARDIYPAPAPRLSLLYIPAGVYNMAAAAAAAAAAHVVLYLYSILYTYACRYILA